MLWAVGKVKMAIVAPPSEESPPNLTVPEILSRWTGPRAITPICCPTANLWLLAVAVSMATSPGALGQCPLARPSGLNRWPSGV